VDRDLQALRRELARFERRVRAMSLLGLAAAVIAAVLIVGARQAQSQQAALSARTVTVVDNNGRPRIVLGSDTNDRPGIWLRDDAGKDRLYFGFGTPGKPQFALSDESGRVRLNAGFSVEHGDSQVVLADPAGTTRAYLGFGLQLRTPQLVFSDEHGKDQVYAGWTRGGAPVLQLVDPSGNVTWAAPGAPGAPSPGPAAPSGGGSGSGAGGVPGNIHKSPGP